MQNRQIFVDTNLLVYAHDRDAAEKHEKAKVLVAELWNRPLMPAVSVQVLQELYVNLIRKNVSDIEARQTVDDYRAWFVVDNDTTLLMEGIEIRERLQSSFYNDGQWHLVTIRRNSGWICRRICHPLRRTSRTLRTRLVPFCGPGFFYAICHRRMASAVDEIW